METEDEIILKTENLKKYFPVKTEFLKRRIGWIKAVDGVDLWVRRGEVFGLVGESGCGKSTLGKTVVGIYQVTEGKVYFENNQISNISLQMTHPVRKRIQYVYQDSGASLDPWWTVGSCLKEPLRIHERLSSSQMELKVNNILTAVGLEETHVYRYPHEFSGGQQRRIGLARVLVLNPRLIVFDEPTSGLDVSVQATILKLLKSLKEQFELTYVFISHDLSVIRIMSNRLAVMYLGKIVEEGSTAAVFESPKHPYTEVLLAAIPQIQYDRGSRKSEELIRGEPPNPQDIPAGCRFHPRCEKLLKICTEQDPQLVTISDGRRVACHLYGGDCRKG